MKKLFTILAITLASTFALTGCDSKQDELDAANSTISRQLTIVINLLEVNKNLYSENKILFKVNDEQANVIADQNLKIAQLTQSKDAEFRAKQKARGQLQVMTHQRDGAKATAQAAVDRAAMLEKKQKVAGKPALKKAS